MSKIKIGVVGYGNVGRAVIAALKKSPDMELVGIFTRRVEEVERLVGDIAPVFDSEIDELPVDVDVAILCGGSATDLWTQGPQWAYLCSTVDSFDTHREISTYGLEMFRANSGKKTLSCISAGWDPGMFSLQRVLAAAFLPGSRLETFWGPGVSQGHSDAARRVNGVRDARSYTLPIETTVEQVRSGEAADLQPRDKHQRRVFVVPEDGADQAAISQAIKEMPNYFAEYNTEVFFVSEAEMAEMHSAFPHGGFVLANGQTANGQNASTEYRCTMVNNPAFTAGILVACARAVYQMHKDGWYGPITMLEIPPAYYHSGQIETLIKKYM